MDFPEASQIPAVAVMHISIFRFIFWLKTCDIQRPHRDDTKWQLGGGREGVIRSSDMRIPDLRCPGPRAGSEYQLAIFKLSTKYFMSSSSYPPISSATTFHFHPVDTPSVIITIVFFAGKNMIALHRNKC